MRKIYFYLFILLIISCTSPREYLAKGNYQKAFDKSIKEIGKKPLKARNYEDIIFTSFQKANENDVNNINLLINNNKPSEQFSKLLNNIKVRQNKLRTHQILLNQADKDSINGWVNLDDVKQEINKMYFKNYSRYYQKFYDSVSYGKKEYAVLASYHLDMMEAHDQSTLDYSGMRLNLGKLGSTYTSVNYDNKSGNNMYDDVINLYEVMKHGNQFYHFIMNDEEQAEDYVLRFALESVNAGYENISSNSSFFTKEVIDHYECKIVKKEIPQPDKAVTVCERQGDTVIQRTIYVSQPPLIVEERISEPVYITVSATVTTTTATKCASAKLIYTLYDTKTDEIIDKGVLRPIENYSDESVDVTGDSRALDYCISENYKILSFPSDQYMLKNLRDQTYHCISKKMKSIATEKYRFGNKKAENRVKF